MAQKVDIIAISFDFAWQWRKNTFKYPYDQISTTSSLVLIKDNTRPEQLTHKCQLHPKNISY